MLMIIIYCWSVYPQSFPPTHHCEVEDDYDDVEEEEDDDGGGNDYDVDAAVISDDHKVLLVSLPTQLFHTTNNMLSFYP